MTLYLLDTNIVSKMFVAKPPQLTARIRAMPVQSICISVVTEAEILYGLQKRTPSSSLTAAIDVFLRSVDVLTWGREAAAGFASLKAASSREGLAIAPLDLMIAAHALAAGATLITNDTALKRIGHLLPVEDWTE